MLLLGGSEKRPVDEDGGENLEWRVRSENARSRALGEASEDNVAAGTPAFEFGPGLTTGRGFVSGFGDGIGGKPFGPDFSEGMGGKAFAGGGEAGGNKLYLGGDGLSRLDLDLDLVRLSLRGAGFRLVRSKTSRSGFPLLKWAPSSRSSMGRFDEWYVVSDPT